MIDDRVEIHHYTESMSSTIDVEPSNQLFKARLMISSTLPNGDIVNIDSHLDLEQIHLLHRLMVAAALKANQT